MVGHFQVSLLSSIMKLSCLLTHTIKTGYCLAQTHMLTLLNYRNMDADLIKESKCLSDRFKNRHKDFEEYIAEVTQSQRVK